MTAPDPDYTAQHRVVALQCAVGLSHMGLFTSLKEVIEHAEVLFGYLHEGTVPS